MGLFSSLFAADKAVDNVMDKDNGLLAQAGNWIGGFNYTEEEKAEADAHTREWGLRQLEALAPFKVMQRIMVTIIMSVWALICLVIIVAICLDATTVINNMLLFVQTQFVWVPVAGAVGLYLMGGVIPRKGQS
jgi:hypothetical protein